MPERSEAILRVEPNQIPAIRSAFVEAAETVTAQLDNLRREGQIPEPWMNDPVSAKIKAIYDDNALNGPNATLVHLEMYRNELKNVAENLARMEEDYRRTEGDNSALWGSQL